MQRIEVKFKCLMGWNWILAMLDEMKCCEDRVKFLCSSTITVVTNIRNFLNRMTTAAVLVCPS